MQGAPLAQQFATALAQSIPPPTANIPKTTAVYQKRKEQQATAGIAQKRYKTLNKPRVCSFCKKVQDSATHKHYYGKIYCQETATVSYEEWLASVKLANPSFVASATSHEIPAPTSIITEPGFARTQQRCHMMNGFLR